ncbi:MAG: methyltransferase [Gammaproteobacteria bacterium]|nr:methyltransferase [Gammaproteobacteria bacterium]
MAAPLTQALMMQLVNGYIVSQALRTVAEYEIADRLSGGPKTADELAALTGTNAGAMHRVLRALSSIGVFEAREGRYQLTPLAEYLRKDSPESVWPAAMVLCNELYKVAQDLPTSVRTGEGGFSRVYGMDFFEYLTQNPSRGALFDSMMTSLHGPETAAIVAAYDFSQMSRLVDVGGGNGDLLRAVLAANPNLQGVLFDLPEVTGRTRVRLASDPVAGRVTISSGDFFKSVVAGGDGYMLRHIIHDWGDAESVHILDRCRSAMGPGIRLLVMEEVIPEGNVPSPAKWLDVAFLTVWSGRERTEDDYRQLLRRAGFRLNRVIPTSTLLSIIEAVSV